VVIDNRRTHNSTSSGWEIAKHEVPQGSILGPLFFLLYYINDLPKTPTNKAQIILYAADPSSHDLKININKVFVDINEWVKTNLLSLN
jgi:hypothetical protein